jgi:hypothetical protein
MPSVRRASVSPLRRSGLLAALLVCATAAHSASPADGQGRFDAGRIGWTSLEFAASRLWLSAEAKLSARTLVREAVATRLIAPGEGTPVVAPGQLIEVGYGARGMGRASDTILWLDPANGAAVQRSQLDSGSRSRHRVYRYTDVGAWHETHWPADAREVKLPPEQWTEQSAGLRPYPAAANGLAISDPTALLWLIGAADLVEAGDRLELHTFSRRHVHRVTVVLSGTAPARVDYAERASRRERRRTGEVQALRLVIRGQPLVAEGSDDEAFELLGLQGDIELLLDPASRAPLALGGKAKIVGQVVFRLRRATLR